MMDNATVMITMFTLGALSGTEKYRGPLFFVTLLCYCVIWVVNLAIIVTIVIDKSLHEPMYVFLCNLCVNGLYGATAFYPKFLSDLLSATPLISYAGCLLQGFLIHTFVSADFSLLAVMAFDRYVAICRPLEYHSVMTKQRVAILLFFAWLIPHFLLLLSTATTANLPLCGSHISKIYCINYVINKLTCTTSLASMIIPAFNYSFYGGHFLLVLWSYIYLIKTCIKSKEGRNKFVTTCLPHLFCLITFTASSLFDFFIRFSSKDVSQNLLNFMAIEFLFVPPIVNPLIYGLKLTKIRNRIAQFFLQQTTKNRILS